MLMAVTEEGKFIALSDIHPATNLAGFSGYAYSKGPGLITLVPTPTETKTGELVAAVAYMPSVGETTIDDIFVSQFYEVILNGVKSRMMSMPAKPFSNAQMASMHQYAYVNGISRARDTARRRFTTAEASWAFPRWA